MFLLENDGYAKIMEMPGFEPGAFRMRSERDTPTLHPRSCLSLSSIMLNTIAKSNQQDTYRSREFRALK